MTLAELRNIAIVNDESTECPDTGTAVASIKVARTLFDWIVLHVPEGRHAEIASAVLEAVGR